MTPAAEPADPSGTHRAAAVRWSLRGDRGSVSVELVIVTPLVLFLLLAIVQFALWSHATHIAQAATAQGLAAARVRHGTAAGGSAAAQRVLDQLGHGPLTDPRIDTTRRADVAWVRVNGHAVAVIPFLHLPVHAEATGPVERFVPSGLADGRTPPAGAR